MCLRRYRLKVAGWRKYVHMQICPETWDVSCSVKHQLSIHATSLVFVITKPLWYSGQSSWLQIQRSWFDSRRYHIFWDVVGLERGPLSLVSTIAELLGRKTSSSHLGTREYGRREPSRWPCGTINQQKLALTSPTSGGRSVGIVRSRTQTTEFVCCLFLSNYEESITRKMVDTWENWNTVFNIQNVSLTIR
jgi:hypothetical protein